ncbi:hypothetical protein [Thorsellia kenyensis]|uniref:Uncharacterized protein n=1 Tax=Thorsellia kenyensis TaxID=1549888 RepID=A0ABV6C6I9_9GAMM
MKFIRVGSFLFLDLGNHCYTFEDTKDGFKKMFETYWHHRGLTL